MARKILQSKKDLWSGFTKQSNRTFGSFLKGIEHAVQSEGHERLIKPGLGPILGGF